MPQQERYEQIIADKLHGLPVPDLSDAIWARIEAQLDIDLPSDEEGDIPQPVSPEGGGIWAGAGLLVLVGALITYFYFQQPPATTPQAIPEQNKTIQPLAKPTNPITGLPASKPPGTVSTDKNISHATKVPVTTDSTQRVASALLQAPDSVQALTVQAVSDPPAKATDTIPRKKRGMAGLNDQDYRIVPKRDSTN